MTWSDLPENIDDVHAGGRIPLIRPHENLDELQTILGMSERPGYAGMTLLSSEAVSIPDLSPTPVVVDGHLRYRESTALTRAFRSVQPHYVVVELHDETPSDVTDMLIDIAHTGVAPSGMTFPDTTRFIILDHRDHPCPTSFTEIIS